MPSCAVLRDCGQEPLQFHWFCVAAKFFKTLYFVGTVARSRRLHADIALITKCWTAEFIEACEDLRASDRYTNCVKAAEPLPLRDFVVDLRERLHAVWRELDGADPRTHAHKLATYHAWMASQAKRCKGPSPFAACWN